MKKVRPIKKIQYEILKTLITLVSIMTILIAVISITVNIISENRSLDENLQNIAQAVSRSQIVQSELKKYNERTESVLKPYLDSMKDSMSNIDVISVVDVSLVRLYHTNSSLIGTEYNGTIPDFSRNEQNIYVTSDIGPSGKQRRAYAAVYDINGDYAGFVITVMLNQNINRIILRTVMIHLICAAAVIICAVILSKHLSKNIKDLLLGYEPDTFSAMFSVRDNILESLDEGILAIDSREKLLYMNKAAMDIMNIHSENAYPKETGRILSELSLKKTLESGEKSFGVSLKTENGSEIIADRIPVLDHGTVTGALCIVRDRTEYTRIMEELSGVKFLAESMRANNHDFTNKLHVILGLIQMGKNREAGEYITNITSIQQSVLNNIMKNIEDPSVAALLIGKYSRAAELNIQFSLENGSRLNRNDISLPSGDLVTIIGNLLENAMDSMNESAKMPKELTIGIFTQPHAMIINIDDTGTGIPEENLKKIYDYGFSTKGKNRGTGLHIVKELTDRYNGTVSVETETETGTSFTVTLTDERSDSYV